MIKNKIYILSILLVLFGQCVPAQKVAHVMDWKTDATLNTALVQQMHAQYAERQKHFEGALGSAKAAAKYQAGMSALFNLMLGELPERTTLDARITGVLQRDGYRIEKVVYQSFPHHHVTANLYVPDGKGPFAATLLFCGHEDVSKATESYQKTAILFARNGFVVLVIDPISQSERYQLTDKDGKPLTRGGTTEHTLLNAVSTLVGSSTPADELWDNERGLDYLVSRPEVDTARIGCLGNSGGAMQTIYFAAFDKRIKVFAPCSYLATRDRTMELTGAADGCAQMPNEGAALFELADYLMMAAPRPVLVLAGRYDFIDYTGTVAACEELKKFYRVLGKPERIKLFTYDDGHGISQPKREAAVAWFRRWLYKDTMPVHEGNLVTATPQELQVTAKGQVAAEYADEVSLAIRNRQRFDELKQDRDFFLKRSPLEQKRSVCMLLGIETVRNGNVLVEQKGTASKGEWVYERLILRRRSQVPMPALLFLPKTPATKIIVWLPGEGKDKLADSAALMDRYLSEGAAVLLADLRGLGETTDRAEFNDSKFYNSEYRNDLLALHTGRNLVGQRMEDVETVLFFIEQNMRLKNLPVEVHASGFAALPALHAALFASGNKKWILQMPLLSYREVLDRPVQKDWYPCVIPDVLRFYDLPGLVKLVGEDKVTVTREER